MFLKMLKKLIKRFIPCRFDSCRGATYKLTRKVGTMKYPKYTWIGNKLTKEQVAAMYQIKQETKLPMTEQVKEAVSLYLKQKGVQHEQS